MGTLELLHPLCCHASESLGSHSTWHFLLFLLNLEKGDNNSFHGGYKNYMRYMQRIWHRIIQAHFLPPVAPISWRTEMGDSIIQADFVLWLVACCANVCLGIPESLKLSQLLEGVKMMTPSLDTTEK